MSRLRSDLSRYRRVVFLLHEHRKETSEITCAEVHTSVSLKHNHIYNELAHLAWIDDLLSVQLDLFEC